MTELGTQEGAKTGRPSQHPLIAFMVDVKLVANFWLRIGDTPSANNSFGNIKGKVSFSNPIFWERKLRLFEYSPV